MKIIIAGPRYQPGTKIEVTDITLVDRAMEIAATKGLVPTEIISGMAVGVDTLGILWAKRNNIPVVEMPAHWERADGSKDMGAGYRRNEQMAAAADAAVVLFDGVAKGTSHMLDIARSEKLKLYVHRIGEYANQVDEEVTAEDFDLLGGGATDPADLSHPKTVFTTRRHKDILYVAGEGRKNEDGSFKQADIMFIATSLLDEEARETQTLNMSGLSIPNKPRYLKGSSGILLKDLCAGVNINLADCFYTTVCKWLLPKSTRLKPKKADIKRATPALLEEIKVIKPKIIVCLGKPGFDVLVDFKISMSDARGAWFTSDKAPGAKIYLLDDPTKIMTKSEFYERFRADFLEISRLNTELQGVIIPQIPLDYRIIRNFSELCSLASEMIAGGHRLQSVDCEWGGTNHIDGNLRSIQLCWLSGTAAYIRFTAPKGDTWALHSQNVAECEAAEKFNVEKAWADEWEYVFDVPYSVAGNVLGSFLNEPDVRYIGHHISADFPWMYHVLGLEYWDKCVLDTEFASQCVNESEGHGLERVALKHSPFGRYDIDLILSKKHNVGKVNSENGYLLVPDACLIPYALRDVDVPMRAYQPLRTAMEREDTWTYYEELFNPFVTSIFTDFTIQGLEIDIPKLDRLRSLYVWATDEMTKDFQKLVMEEARGLFFKYLMELTGGSEKAFEIYQKAMEPTTRNESWTLLKVEAGPGGFEKAEAMFLHFTEAPMFNIRSTSMMRRWLYQVKGLTPVKSTGNKENGSPSVPWEKVLGYPPEKQKEFTPAADKQTLLILGEQDILVMKLLDLNAVGNVKKAFLKPAEMDYDDEGNLVAVKENGLHFWIASDGKVHGMFSATETGRPRAWNPNSLNWPKWVNEKITAGIGLLVKNRHEAGELPEEFEMYLSEKIPSIRSVVVAGEGNVFAEDDYKTAELVAWAVISGDENFIRMLTEPDPEFGLVMHDGSETPVRIEYLAQSPVPAAERNPAFILSVAEDSKISKTYTVMDLLRNEEGELRHPIYDLHWSLAEAYQKKPREALNKDKHRGAGKVGNFSSAYGATADTLERKIESDTGVKPEPGTGQAILDALYKRQPKAFLFMENQEELPSDPGYYRCASGRVRHFVPDKMYLASLDYRSRRSLLSRLGREARNVPPQESVAATAARAAIRLQRHFRSHGMKSRVSICLYDSLVCVTPFAERFECQRLMRKYMSEENTWDYSGRTLKYDIDEEFLLAWSWKTSKETKRDLWDPEWGTETLQKAA
jgi:uracil-DNA glycosylase family 4